MRVPCTLVRTVIDGFPVKAVFKKSPAGGVVPVVTSLAFWFSGHALAGFYFDPAMLSGDPSQVADLSRLSVSGAQLPGVYQVDIHLNNSLLASREVRFISAPGESKADIHDSTGLMACLTPEALAGMGVKVEAFAELANQPKGQCVSPGRFIPLAWTAFDFRAMRLDISIPQVAMQRQPNGWIPPERWDEGVDAALMSWQFSGNESDGRYGNSRSQYLNLTSGLNLGAWRLRDNSTWSSYQNKQGSTRRWQHLNTYVQRAIIPWRSELTLGDASTRGDVFDSLSFRGVQLASDESMLPDTLRGFAPVVRGTANSSAEVSVLQNGYEIYRTQVAAGAFVIDDLYSVSQGGDLDVRITEADGSTRVFTVPYSSVPMLQREGNVRYELTAGRYRSNSDSYDDPMFTQGTLFWGLPHGITAYGGAQFADNYKAASLGAGFNMGEWGAISADLTQANSTLADGSQHAGQSLRFLYGRSLVSTGTTFQLAGYRYSTRGFYTLGETALKGMSGWTEKDEGLVDASGRPIERNWYSRYNLYSSRRAQLQANISQDLGSLGSLYLSGSRQTYWNDSASTSSLQFGFNSSIGDATYQVSYDLSRQSGQPHTDKTLYFSVSLPLGGSSGGSTWASYSAKRDSNGATTHQAGLNGTALDDGRLNWSVAQGYGRQDGRSGDAALGYQGTYGNVSAGFGYDDNYQQVRYGASGSAVLHADGLTLGQPLGNTNILVAAPGASGVPVESGTGVRTDWRGYTLVPYASTYRENRVGLDVSQLDDHTEIDTSVARVVPTQGALVRADFRTRVGARVLMTLTHAGKPVPFAATVDTVGASGQAMVGEAGQVYLTGLGEHGELAVRWGAGQEQQCRVHYMLSKEEQEMPLVLMQESCK